MSYPKLTDKASCLTGIHLIPGLEELFKARWLAQDADCELWEFAVGISALRRLGLTESDLRWLLQKGYVEHAHETTNGVDRRRVFDLARAMTFSRRTCFVLTQPGTVFAESLAKKSPSQSAIGGPKASTEANAVAEIVKPRWDHGRHQLVVADIIVKRYRWPARNQETILLAFEEDEWPSDGIYDPLPPDSEKDSKQRLRDTIRCLNRHQTRPYVRFRGDGTGQRVQWEFARAAIEDLKLKAIPSMPKKSNHRGT